MQTQATSIQGFRLSPQQKQLWLQQAGGDARAYAAIASVRANGIPDVQKLEVALQQLVERHEILRTTFQALPGMEIPLQVVQEMDASEANAVELKTIDLSHLSEAEQQGAIVSKLQALQASPLQLDRLPVIDFIAIQCSD
ncbi:MAG: condensation domain-containing protein, partial [Cyanobacteria bacterium P01_F01_bin.33]